MQDANPVPNFKLNKIRNKTPKGNLPPGTKSQKKQKTFTSGLDSSRCEALKTSLRFVIGAVVIGTISV